MDVMPKPWGKNRVGSMPWGLVSVKMKADRPVFKAVCCALLLIASALKPPKSHREKEKVSRH